MNRFTFRDDDFYRSGNVDNSKRLFGVHIRDKTVNLMGDYFLQLTWIARPRIAQLISKVRGITE